MPLDTPTRAWARTTLLAAVACIGTRSAFATEPGYEVTVGIEETDNVQRLPSGGSTATQPFEEVEFVWHDKRPLYAADIDANLANVTYIPRVYGDEVIGNFLGHGVLNLVPQLLTWNITDNFGQGVLNPLAPVTPGNRENINYFTTGPKLSVPLGQELKLDVTGQYGRVDYEDSPYDSNLVTGGIALVHEFSVLSKVSINVVDERTYYVQSQYNPDVTDQEVYLHYNTTGSRTRFAVDLGYDRTEEAGESTQGSFLARVSLSRKLSGDSIVGLSAGHEYSDGTQNFLRAQTLGGATLNTQSIVESNAPFSTDYGTLSWNFQRARTSWGIGADYFKDTYQTDSALNNDTEMVDAHFERQMTPLLTLELTEYLVRQNFPGEGGSITQSNSGLQLKWHAGRNFSVIVAYFLAKGTGDFLGDKYTANSLWLSVGYGRPAEVPPGPPPVQLLGGFGGVDGF
jgi:hypothetical protein